MKTIITILLLTAIAVCLGFIGCQMGNRTYILSTGVQPGSHDFTEVGKEIGALLNGDEIVKMEVVSGEGTGSHSNRDYLLKGKADFALMSSDAGSHPDIAVVLPLYPMVLYIVHPATIEATTLSELVKGRRIGVGPEGSSTARIAHLLFEHFDIDTQKCTIVYNTFEQAQPGKDIDVAFLLTGYNSPVMRTILAHNGLKLFSFDAVERYHFGSTIEGFCLAYPYAQPFTIPIASYSGVPDKPVMTISLDATLYARRSVSAHLVYKIVDHLLGNRRELSERNPLFRNMSDSYLRQSDAYRYHEGTRRYIDRNFPALLERFSLWIWLIGITVLIVLIIMYARRRNNLQRQKERIETLYSKALLFEEQIAEYRFPEECDLAIKAVHDYKRSALRQLALEELAPDNNFLIFMELLEDIVNDIRGKRESLRRAPHSTHEQ